MTDGVGLAIGVANVRAVHVGRAALTRSAVLTRYPHRPSEVGVPGENPNLAERGLVIADFVDRVGDPVPIVASDGSSHAAAAVTADALRALLRALIGGMPGAEPVGVAHPAFWRPAAVDALRAAITAIPDFRSPVPALLVPDATAALVALQQERGLPSRGVVAVCDFGATGTSITLADASAGYASIAATVRVEELSGDVIDQALLTHVIADLSTAGSVDLSGTSALGSLTRLRSQCRAAKERLSTTPVTALTVEALGPHGEVRITRNELDGAIRAPLAAFVAELQDTLRRNDVRHSDLVAVASIGGGARIPIVTTTLSEHLRLPVVTAERPELVSAIGAGLRAVRATVVEGATSIAPAASVASATRAAPSLSVDAPRSTAFQALAWSAADDAPEVVEAFDSGSDPDPYHSASADPEAARPRLAFDPAEEEGAVAAETPWYRRRAALSAAGLVGAFVAVAAVVLFAFRGDPATEPATSPSSVTTTSAAPPSDAPTGPSEPAAEPPAPEPLATAPAPAPPQRTVTRRESPPPTVTVTTEQPAPPPPPSSQTPPPSEPPAQSPPASNPAPSSTAQPTNSPQNPFNLPYSTLPGLPFVPAPPGIPAPNR